jgi:hypothetical protein
VLLLAPAIVLLLATNLYPTLNALWWSFYAYDASIPNATPVFVGLGNYQQLLTESAFRNTARITVIFVLVAVTVELVIGIGLGLLIARSRPGSGPESIRPRCRRCPQHSQPRQPPARASCSRFRCSAWPRRAAAPAASSPAAPAPGR